MASPEAVQEEHAYQETLAGLPKYSFHKGATIYWDHGFGKCETEEKLFAEQLKKTWHGLHFYRALNSVKVFCFSVKEENKIRTLYRGQIFRGMALKKI